MEWAAGYRAKVRALESRISGLEHDIEGLKEHLHREANRTLGLRRHYDAVVGDVRARERRRNDQQAQALRRSLEMTATREVRQVQDKLEREFQSEISRVRHRHEEDLRRQKKEFQSRIQCLLRQLAWTKQEVCTVHQDRENQVLILEQVCLCHHRHHQRPLADRSVNARPSLRPGAISRSTLALPSSSYSSTQNGKWEIHQSSWPLGTVSSVAASIRIESHPSLANLDPSTTRKSSLIRRVKARLGTDSTGHCHAPQVHCPVIGSELIPAEDKDDSDEEFFSMNSSLDFSHNYPRSRPSGPSSIPRRVRRHSSAQ